MNTTRPFLRSLCLGLAAVVALAPPARSQGSLPSPSQVQQLLSANPQLGDQIRQRIAQSGMTPDQIRARLKSAGYPDSLLDAYLGGDQGQGGTAGALEIGAIQALGLAPVGAGFLNLDTGVVRVIAKALRAESLAEGNYVFGVDIFRRSRTQFLPVLAGPAPPDYRLGPGDQLAVILTGDVERTYLLPVTREGFVLIPRVGQVFVHSLTLSQFQDVLYDRLGEVYSGVNRKPTPTTHVGVSVISVRSNQVYVIGEVAQPGAYQISALGTVLTGLYASGGVTPRANLRHIEVRRLGKVVDTFDLYDYLLRGDSRNDIRLETGDVVFVPVHGVRAQITGAVTRPAFYELQSGDALPDLLRYAGGFEATAAVQRLTVYRIRPPVERTSGTPPRAAIDVALSPDAAGRHGGASVSADDPGDGRDAIGGMLVPALKLEDGDSVVVDSLPPLAEQYYVGIAGMVRKPGQYPWHRGMTVRDLVLLARGPVVGADLRAAEIARMPADRSKGQLASTLRVTLDSSYLFNRDSTGAYFGPPGVPFPGTGAPEVELEPYDNLLILKQPEFDFQRTVSLTGQVRYPGVYSLSGKTEKLADLIARAGGLTQQAYGEGIRFTRLVNDVGRINVDLPHALADTASRFNIILQPDDQIDIPEYQPAVKVSGAVNSPGSVLWKRGAGLDYYIAGAGGFTYKADKGRVSVRYANGEVRIRRRSLFVSGDPKPGPGSEVSVPDKEATQGPNWVTVASGVTGILSSTIAIIVLLKQL